MPTLAVHVSGVAEIQSELIALCARNVAYLRRNPGTPRLLRSGVVYRREPHGQERWRGIAEILRDGHGDCEDLACWLAAELRLQGIAAIPIVRRNRSGSGYHALVQLPNGMILDPSKALGMK